MGVTHTVSKFFLVLVYIILWLAAGGLIFAGAYTLHIAGTIDNVAKSTYILVPTVIMLASGIFLFAVGLIGCFACVVENKCLLTTFFSCLLLILIAEIGGATLGTIYWKSLENRIQSGLADELNAYGGSDTALTKELDFIQSKYECCGIINSTDWQLSNYSKEHNNTLPPSCYPKSTHPKSLDEDSNVGYSSTVQPTHPTTSPHPAEPFNEGCLNKLEDMFRKYLGLLAGLGLAIALIQAVGLLATCIIMCRTRGPSYERFGSVHGGQRV